MSLNDSKMRTPTKRSHPDESDLSNLMTSPKFIKPSDVFRKRARRSLKLSPLKSSGMKRCVLPLETIVQKKNYSPLKCLKSPIKSFTVTSDFSSSNSSQSNSNSNNQNNENGAKKSITFSPLMKKLQRSPARSAIHFPVVKRNSFSVLGSSQRNGGSLKRQTAANTANNFSRVLDFSEDANFFPEKFDSPTKSSTVSSSHAYISLNSLCVDWSLKSKLRFTANRSIPFHGNLKAIDEATGLSHFVQGERSSTSTSANVTTAGSADNFAAQLHGHCLVWQHPSLPWIKLFPRVHDLRPGAQVSSTKPVFAISATSTLADSLHSDFCASLHSLFKLVKAKHCPYFYMCANNFTVLFRASGVAGSNDTHASIVPTTYGLRKLLKEEGIDYVMPFHQRSDAQSAATGNTSSDTFSSDNSSSSGIGTSESSGLENDEEECVELSDGEGNSDDDENGSSVLESLGLSQQDFPSLETNALRRRRILSKCKSTTIRPRAGDIDDQTAEGKMKSLIRINGAINCQALISVFINHRKICVSTSGPLSGIPPTLLSPVPFHGATLTPLTVRHKTSEDSRSSQPLVSVDVSGPILPHTIYGLTTLFGRFAANSVGSNVTMVRGSLRTFDPSSSFALEFGRQAATVAANVSADPSSIDPTPFNATFAVENLEESGMNKRLLMSLCASDRQLAIPLADIDLTPNGVRYNRSLATTSGRE